jgi:hypothetical protein
MFTEHKRVPLRRDEISKQGKSARLHTVAED